ncbi:MAG: DinB family protein [Pyrinomonadaceae bacterium]
MDTQKQLRQHLLELLEGKFAHIDLESAIKNFPVEQINVRVENSPHTAWQLLEHIRIAQWDILEFSLNAKHKSPKWPDGYWPKKPATKAEWKAAVNQIVKDLKAFRKLVADKETDLYAKILHGDGQTILREVLLVADHNAYHLGQLVLLRKTIEGV